MSRESLGSGVNIRLWDQVKASLRVAAKEMQISASTLARLIIEKSLRQGDYKDVVIPEHLHPTQEFKDE